MKIPRFVSKLFSALAVVSLVGATISVALPAHAEVITGRNASNGGQAPIDVSGGVFRTTSKVTVLASAARTTTTEGTSADISNYSAKGVQLVLDITATGGTTTLDCKVQVKDTLSSKYVDLTGAAFAQKTTTGTTLMTIYPGIATTSNVAVSTVLPDTWRGYCAITGSGSTFSLGAHYIN